MPEKRGKTPEEAREVEREAEKDLLVRDLTPEEQKAFREAVFGKKMKGDGSAG